jgi:hypothetical protein
VTSSEPTGREDPMSAYQRLSAVNQRLDRDAFILSSVIERLVLQVIGGWEQVKAALNFHKYAAAGAGYQMLLYSRKGDEQFVLVLAGGERPCGR